MKVEKMLEILASSICLVGTILIIISYKEMSTFVLLLSSFMFIYIFSDILKSLYGLKKGVIINKNYLSYNDHGGRAVLILSYIFIIVSILCFFVFIYNRLNNIKSDFDIFMWVDAYIFVDCLRTILQFNREKKENKYIMH